MNDKFTSTDYYFFLLFLLLSILFITSGGGADYPQYLKWSEYFLTLNLDTFSDYPKSKNGLPLSVWYYGIGLLTSALGKISFLKGLALMKATSSILVIINFALFYKICSYYKISRFSFLFFISAAYLMLPAGFYLNKYSTETWTIFLALLSIYLIEHDVRNFKNLRTSSLIIFGIILYFLVLIKIPNVFLALTLLLIFYVKKFDKILISKKNFYINFKILLFGSLFILFAAIMLAIYHKLLTGNYLGSPYNIGNSEYSQYGISNLKNFKIKEVLFSTWHGLLFYHPFYLLSILFLLIIPFRKNFKENNLKWILLFVSILFLIHLIFASLSSGWWNGMGTYGARQFAGISVLTFYAVLNIKDNFKPIKFNFLAKIIILIVLVHQTYLLSFGETNFYTFSNYFYFFFTKRPLTLFFLLILVLVLIFTLKQIYNYNFSKALQITVISMALFAATAFLFFYHKKPFVLLFLAMLISYFFSYSTQYYINKIKQISSNFVHKIVSIIFAFLFLYSIIFQVILFTQYKENIKPNFISGRNFSCTDSLSGLLEYQNLPNYHDEKEQWANFLIENGCV